MLTFITWIPRVLWFFGMFRQVYGVAVSSWPKVNALFQRRLIPSR